MVLQVLMRELKLDARTAEMTYAELTTPGHGLNPDCAFDMRGFRNVLALRAEMEGQWGGQAPSPERFVDLSAYQRARTALGRAGHGPFARLQGGLVQQARQRLVVYRLDHVVVKAGCQGSGPISRLAIAGQRHDERASMGTLSPQLPGQFGAVHVGQTDVEHKHINHPAGGMFQRGARVKTHAGFMTVEFEQRGQGAGSVLVVIDHMHPQRPRGRWDVRYRGTSWQHQTRLAGKADGEGRPQTWTRAGRTDLTAMLLKQAAHQGQTQPQTTVTPV